jgi:hypothetical protein
MSLALREMRVDQVGGEGHVPRPQGDEGRSGTLHLSELRFTLLSYSEPTELRCTLYGTPQGLAHPN